MASCIFAVGMVSGVPADFGDDSGVIFGHLSTVATDAVLVGMLFD